MMLRIVRWMLDEVSRRQWGHARSLGVVLLVALALALAQPVAAQPDPEVDEEEVGYLEGLSLEDLLNVEFAVVTGASRYSQTTLEAPAFVTVVTADDIRTYGYQTLAEVLKAQSGFETSNDRNYTTIGVRGFQPPGDYSSRILVLVDGHRVNDALYDAPSVARDSVFDLDLVDSIEIIRGPSSSLYGTNALLAVINIVTKEAQEIDGLQLAAGIGTRDTYEARATYGKEFFDDLDFQVSGDYYSSDNDDRLFFEEFDDPTTNNGVARNVDDEEAYRFGGTIRYRDFTLSGNYSYRWKQIPTASYETVFADQRADTIDTRGYVDLAYNHAFENALDVNVRAYWDRQYYSGDYPFDWSEDETPYIVVNQDKSTAEWWGAEALITKELGSRNKFVVGAEYRDLYQLDQENFDEEVYLDSNKDAHSWAVFAQNELKIIPDLLMVNAGIRYDEWSTSGGIASPRVALILSPNANSAIKALYGRAFRAPSAYELYYNDGEFTQKANPDLDAETIDTYELVVQYAVSDDLRISASVFHYEIQDLIAETIDPMDDLLVFENTSSARSTGVETELVASWEDLLDGRLSYTYQDARDSQGRLMNAPEHLVKLNLGASVFSERLRLGFETQYVSERETVVGEGADDYFVSNLALSTDRVLKNLELSVIVRNLFDTEIRTPVSGAFLQNDIQQDGIRALFKATYTFR